MLDSATGEVLTAATEPPFSPAAGARVPAEVRRDRALLDTYEPGSEIKPLVVAAALERHLLTPATRFDTPMARRLPGGVIHDAVPHPAAPTTLGVLRYSSNVDMSRVAEAFGAANLYAALAAFGAARDWVPWRGPPPPSAKGCRPPWSSRRRSICWRAAALSARPCRRAPWERPGRWCASRPPPPCAPCSTRCS